MRNLMWVIMSCAAMQLRVIPRYKCAINLTSKPTPSIVTKHVTMCRYIDLSDLGSDYDPWHTFTHPLRGYVS